jgi:cell division protease FtsH
MADMDLGKDIVLKTSVEDIAKTFAKYKYMMLDIEEANRFMGINPNEQFKLRETYPKFMNSMVSQSVNKYIEVNGFKVIMEKNYRYGEREEPVEYTDMTVGRNENKNLIAMGYLYLMNDEGMKAIMMIDFIHASCCGFLEIICNKKDSNFFQDSIKEINRYVDEFDYFRGEKISMSGSLLNVNDYDWCNIVLEAGIRESIEGNVIGFFNKRDIYQKNGVPFKRGVILEGPPGTGKTLISKILANKIENTTFILATAADIEEAEDVTNLFKMARRYSPTIVFMEDIDFFAQNRSESSFARITGELLTQLDGIEDNNGIVVVATTNHQEMLDEAIVHRPGRFDVMIHVGTLGIENRQRLLNRFLAGRQKTEYVDFYRIAEKCEGFTGSHMKELANSVCILAINSNSLDDNGYIILLNEHFDEAIERIRKHCNICSKDNNIIKENELISIVEESKPTYYSGFNGYLFKKEENNK